jgi:hypothetical protein
MRQFLPTVAVVAAAVSACRNNSYAQEETGAASRPDDDDEVLNAFAAEATQIVTETGGWCTQTHDWAWDTARSLSPDHPAHAH